MRAFPPPPSEASTPMTEEDAMASTVPAPPAVLIEDTVEIDESSLVPPPVSGQRRAPMRVTLPYAYVKRSG